MSSSLLKEELVEINWQADSVLCYLKSLSRTLERQDIGHKIVTLFSLELERLQTYLRCCLEIEKSELVQ